ncbi:carboxy-terminal domain RNA polymerase II polypeptide A small phosphatase 1-like [Cucurbita pepo subsp. pepo]|uniref:carboxy-terminal domain RNA polymerase II polypeptide A small phosphatase 1-like n=1 Tax=Cucurbita pepo subsp. pepo TaxID=3664 RepID=UPI000C9D33CC|nr:carboxy-terminal domain RNA polymerase II polypeptide A small phosphatase 1-like [Cucurbita pepo subsp. pepo]
MVSKIIKTSLTNPFRRQRRKSPVKNAASSTVAATIRRSLSTCHRRLLKIFSKLTGISTPNRYKGYKALRTTAPTSTSKSTSATASPEPDIVRTLVFDNHLLPPLFSPAKRTVLLDLDETLIHSKLDPPPKRFDFVVRPRVDGEILKFYVLKRPGVDQFLEALADRFEIVVFTAGMREYASLVLNNLDKKSVISHRLYRDSCKEVDGKFVKDLSEIGRDLRRVVIVDDNPNAYVFQPENAIPIPSFIDDPADMELRKLVNFFEICECYDDMRDAVKQYLSG